MNPARLLAKQIAESPGRGVFGVPGGGPSLELIDGLMGQGVDFVRTATEGNAAVMAGTWGRLSGRAGVAVSIKGPGLANMVPGLAACRLEAFPVVAIAEAYPSQAALSLAHKRMDHRALSADTVKDHRAFSSGGLGFAALAAHSEREVPGPVLLDLAASDEAPVGPASRPAPTEHDDERAFDLLTRAERPVVIAGTLAIRQQWGPELAALNVPVFSTAAAKGVIDETLEHAAGVFTGVGLSLAPEAELLAESDLVVGLGLRSNELLAATPFAAPSLNIDPLGAKASPGLDFAATDGLARASAMLSALREKAWSSDRLARAATRLRARLLQETFLPATVYELVWQRFAGDARLVLDTGNFCTIGEHLWRARSPVHFLGAGQSRYMGIGLPMALAAALWDGTRPTVAAVGDGGVGMAFGELKIAIERKLPLIVAFMCDGGFASIRQRARMIGATTAPLLVGEPSWWRAAEGMGLSAFEVRDARALDQVLADWKITDGPLFLECRFEPDSYLAMTDELR